MLDKSVVELCVWAIAGAAKARVCACGCIYAACALCGIIISIIIRAFRAALDAACGFQDVSRLPPTRFPSILYPLLLLAAKKREQRARCVHKKRQRARLSAKKTAAALRARSQQHG